MRKFFIILALLFLINVSASAFETKFMSVDFEKMELVYNNKTYQLVEVKSKARRSWREVTYLCIDEKLHAVAFRLFVTDEGEFLRLQKYTSRRK